MKKLANQIMSFILVLTMVFATGTTAFAAEQNSTFLIIRRLENITVNEQKIECNLLIMYCPYVKIKRQYP